MISSFVSRLLVLAAAGSCVIAQVPIGPLVTRNHLVEGQVVALSERVLEISNFRYDGTAPAAFFWADTRNPPSSGGFILQDGDPLGTCGEGDLPFADGTETYRVEFPEGTSVLDVLGGSISVWCEAFSANFGEVEVPAELPGLAATEDGPALQCSESPSSPSQEIFLGDFITRDHDVEGSVFALSESVLEVRGFVYDGEGPATFFWADTDDVPSTGGFILQDGAPSSSCGTEELPEADGSETFRVEFPEGTSLNDVLGGSISVWCNSANANFGEIVVPDSIDGLLSTEDGPALECAGGTPPGTVPEIAITPEGYNCEPMNDFYQVRWQVDGQNLNVEVVGLIDDGVYMGFGISGSDDETDMVGADATVCDLRNGEFRARDFYMNARAQCSNGDGVCPDPFTDTFNDDASNVSGEQDAGVTLVRFTRPLIPLDVNETVEGEPVDRPISVTPGEETFIVWAVGPILEENGLPFFHDIAFPRNEEVSLDFGRAVQDNCPLLVGGTPPPSPETEPPVLEPFFRPPLVDTTEFSCHIGPSGGDRGYSGITNRTAWGIAWYINDLLIPKIEMRRGTTYTFLVNGGDDPELRSEFHPMYLTTSPLGGWAQRTPEERDQETVVAGLTITDNTDEGFEILAAGPLCQYEVTEDTQEAALTGTYPEFFASLDSSCADDTSITDAAAVLEFTPDGTTPDLIYYQCVTHTSLGFEISVIDEDAESSVQVNCSNIGDNPIALGDVTVNAVIDPVAGVLNAEVIYDGIGWVAMGFTEGFVQMVGSEAVIGLPDEPNGPTNPGKYNLNAQSVSGVQLMPEEQQTLTDATIEQADGQTILRFTKILVEPGEHPISATEENTFLFAFGSDNDLAIHQTRGGFTVQLSQCPVFVDGELINEQFIVGGEVDVDDDGPNRDLWAAHGICAATAWAILVPLAIGSSIIRNTLEKIGLPKGFWFTIHRGLNMIAIALTIAAFSIAVHLVNQRPDPEHFSLIRHHTVGLVIFILAILQGIMGILRPHGPHAIEINELDEEDNEVKMHELVPEEKSCQRKSFEILHRLVGITLIGLAWWQVQSGFTLFANLFLEDDLTDTFWIVVGSICGFFLLVFLYEKIMMGKENYMCFKMK